ncbi:Beta-1,3-glucan-binding protein [Hypsizygus marmoreus]|uniref:Beta-1,3-glucan-binding protein n=1 Tax=Hypsizygus marmoreus TaxID=39966 RepID=A0A369JKD7_HYPMA|nr:Beta-1,3-glucan-binding protein [Hypsizygus marmoreus]
MSKPSLNVEQDDHERLAPPQPQFIIGATGFDGESERHDSTSHSRTTSGAISYVETPPITPRSLTFGSNTNINPFSPPGSVVSFGSGSDLTPAGTPGVHGHQNSTSQYPFPDATPRSGITSRSTSVADFSRLSSHYGSSRPSTADFGPTSSTRPSSARLREAFTSPPPRPLTMMSVATPTKVERERPKSTMLSAKGSLEKPWIKERDPYSRIAYFLTYGMILLGVAAGVARCWTGWYDVPLLKDNLCLVMEENFDSEEGIFGENGKFFREVDMSGFGNGEFEMTTASQNNSFVKDGRLYIAPTLTSDNLGEAAIEDGYVYNITGCTFNITRGLSYTDPVHSTPVSNTSIIGSDEDFDLAGYTKACSAVSNATAGQVINPVQSARLSTRRSASIKYGKVEVRAKIPRGDWLWPAIWMLPVDNNYGPWPLSGEIDIMEARGNGPRYTRQGTNWVRGSLNWGPLTWLNGVAKTYGAWPLRRGTYDAGFHTYGLEWSDEFIRIYVDTRLHHMMPVLNLKKESFWDRGDFPPVVQNGSQSVILNNPWVNGTKAAPFDQSFYLVLNVAVGGTNGWFPDGHGDKPWLDGSQYAMFDFWKNRNQWLPTWPTNVEDRAMVVDSVKMWQQC